MNNDSLKKVETPLDYQEYISKLKFKTSRGNIPGRGKFLSYDKKEKKAKFQWEDICPEIEFAYVSEEGAYIVIDYGGNVWVNNVMIDVRENRTIGEPGFKKKQ